jgi:hypothetical protein
MGWTALRVRGSLGQRAGFAVAEWRRDALVRSPTAACSPWTRAPRCSTRWRYPTPEQGCVLAGAAMRVGPDAQLGRVSADGMRRPIAIGVAAPACAQDSGGVVRMVDGAVTFKGGSISNSKAVRARPLHLLHVCRMLENAHASRFTLRTTADAPWLACHVEYRWHLVREHIAVGCILCCALWHADRWRARHGARMPRCALCVCVGFLFVARCGAYTVAFSYLVRRRIHRSRELNRCVGVRCMCLRCASHGCALHFAHRVACCIGVGFIAAHCKLRRRSCCIGVSCALQRRALHRCIGDAQPSRSALLWDAYYGGLRLRCPIGQRAGFLRWPSGGAMRSCAVFWRRALHGHGHRAFRRRGDIQHRSYGACGAGRRCVVGPDARWGGCRQTGCDGRLQYSWLHRRVQDGGGVVRMVVGAVTFKGGSFSNSTAVSMFARMIRLLHECLACCKCSCFMLYAMLRATWVCLVV